MRTPRTRPATPLSGWSIVDVTLEPSEHGAPQWARGFVAGPDAERYPVRFTRFPDGWDLVCDVRFGPDHSRVLHAAYCAKWPACVSPRHVTHFWKQTQNAVRS